MKTLIHKTKNLPAFLVGLILLAIVSASVTGCSQADSQSQYGTTAETTISVTTTQKTTAETTTEPSETTSDKKSSQTDDLKKAPVLSEIPKYSGSPYTQVNDNWPYFSTDNLPTESFEYYSELDKLGRCGVCVANVGQDIMPTAERGSIGMIKPSGWHTVKYNDLIDGNYLYNRCHLLGYQLTGENANEKNLITGTRYLNVQGMLPFENMIADYVISTANHVLYRVTPIFEGDNLVATGVLMEAYSVEDSGDGIRFNVFCHNVQPGIDIDYRTGESELSEQYKALAEETKAAETAAAQGTENSESSEYILNTNTKKFHYPWCSSVSQMKAKNKKEYTGSRDEIINQGYEPCKRCNP